MQGQPPSPVRVRDDEPTLLETIRILLSEWKLVTTIIFLAAVLSIILALIIQPKYRAEAVVAQVSMEQQLGEAGSLMGSLGGLASLAGIGLGGTDGSGAHAQAVLRSRYLIEEFIRRKELLPVLFPESSDGTAEESDGPRKETESLWFGVKKFTEDIRTIGEDSRTGLLTVSIEWRDPETAANWANELVALANEILRKRALDEAQRNIAFLQEQISKTNVVELQQGMYNLIQQEMQTLMLANVHKEFAFSTIDPAVPPELRVSPHRTLLVVGGTAIGGFLAILVVAFRRMVRVQHARDASIEGQEPESRKSKTA